MSTNTGTIRAALVALALIPGGCGDEAAQPAQPAAPGSVDLGWGYVLAGTYRASGGQVARLLAVGDVDGDGATDVVLADTEGASATVLRNAGDGSLAPMATVALGGEPKGIFLAAMDAHPALDLVTLRGCSELPCAAVEVFSGVGDGVFQPPVAALEVPAKGHYESFVAHAALADLDGDGLDEIYASQSSELHAWLVRRSADGSFISEDAHALEPPALVDLDNDGALDLVGGVENEALNYTAVVRNEGDGSFASRVSVANIGASGLAVGDLNADGNQDLVVVSGTSLALLLGAGDATTFSRQDFMFEEQSPRSPAVIDLDGDGEEDDVLILHGDSVFVLLGEGGTFAPGPAIKVGAKLHALVVADMNGDALPDLLVTRSETADLAVLLRAGPAREGGAGAAGSRAAGAGSALDSAGEDGGSSRSR